MTPMAKARGLQLPRHDKDAAAGGMTAARQNRSPAANAQWGAHFGQFTLATLSARNPPTSQVARGASRTPLAPREAGCLSPEAAYPTHRVAPQKVSTMLEPLLVNGPDNADGASRMGQRVGRFLIACRLCQSCRRDGPGADTAVPRIMR